MLIGFAGICEMKRSIPLPWRACAKQEFRRNDRLVARCGSVWYIVFYKTSAVGATE